MSDSFFIHDFTSNNTFHLKCIKLTSTDMWHIKQTLISYLFRSCCGILDSYTKCRIVSGIHAGGNESIRNIFRSSMWHLPRPGTFVKYSWFCKDDLTGLHRLAAIKEAENFNSSKFKIIIFIHSPWNSNIKKIFCATVE